MLMIEKEVRMVRKRDDHHRGFEEISFAKTAVFRWDCIPFPNPRNRICSMRWAVNLEDCAGCNKSDLFDFFSGKKRQLQCYEMRMIPTEGEQSPTSATVSRVFAGSGISLVARGVEFSTVFPGSAPSCRLVTVVERR